MEVFHLEFSMTNFLGLDKLGNIVAAVCDLIRLKAKQPRDDSTDGDRARERGREAGAPEARKHLFGIVSATRRSYPPILMSASWSAGTSLKLNGETSLHMPKALAMPRRVSLALIKLVGKESNLLGEKEWRAGSDSNDVVNARVSTHTFLTHNLPKSAMATVQTKTAIPTSTF